MHPSTRILILTLTAATFGWARAEWEPQLNLGLNLTDGNSETTVFNAALAVTGQQGANDINLGAEYNYGEAAGDTNVENAKALAEIRRTLSDPVYGYLRADALTDDIAGINHRVTVGPGLGTWLIKKEEAELGIEAGAAWVTEETEGRVVDADGISMVTTQSDDFVTLRVAQNYKRQLSENAKVWQTLEWLPEFEDFDNYLLNAELGAEAPLNGAVNLRLVLQNRYDNQPAPGREDNDLSILAGMGIKL